MNRRIHRAAITLAALATSAMLAACGVGFDTATEEVEPEYPSGDVGPMLVRSLMLIQKEGGGPASAVVTLVNTADQSDTLSSLQISPPATPGVTPSPSPTPLDVQASVSVPARGTVHLGAPDQPTVIIDGLERLAAPGQLVPVTLIFDSAGRLTLSVVVQSGTGAFASFAPTVEPTPTDGGTILPTSTPTASPTG